MTWSATKSHVANVFDKLLKVRRVFSDIASQHNLTALLIHIQALQHQHNVLHIIGKLLDWKLIVINQFLMLCRKYMQLKSVNINVKFIYSRFRFAEYSFNQGC